ncbi:MAG: outer membrane lipoprotein carrier protein LolA [Flavobacteriales bacterium]|nr:outer membrane lipoprotein carrier protein LolA [Flavobacteriales bacterium]
MRNVLFTVIASFGLLCGFSAQAQDRIPIDRSDATVQALLEHSRTTTSLKADFVQEKHLKMLATPVVSTGIIRFKKPGQLRWQVDDTEPSVAVVDGKTVMISKAGKEDDVTAADRQAFSAITNLIEGIVSGELLDGKSMVATFFTTKEGLLVELLPTDPRMAKRLKQVTLLFDTTTHILRELRMEQPSGEFTLTRFSNAKFGVAHGATTFKL